MDSIGRNLRSCFNDSPINVRLMAYLETLKLGLTEQKTIQAICRNSFEMGFDCMNNPGLVVQVVDVNVGESFSSEHDGVGIDFSDPFLIRRYETLTEMRDMLWSGNVPGPWDVILDKGMGNPVKMRTSNIGFLVDPKTFMYSRITVFSSLPGFRSPLQWDRQDDLMVQGELFQ